MNTLQNTVFSQRAEISAFSPFLASIWPLPFSILEVRGYLKVKSKKQSNNALFAQKMVVLTWKCSDHSQTVKSLKWDSDGEDV